MAAQTPTNRIITIIVGFFLGLGAQIVVLPVAIFIGLFIVNSAAIATLGQTDIAVRDSVVLAIFIVIGLILEIMLVSLVFVLARAIKQIGLFQGSCIGALIGLLLYSGCWSLFVGGAGM